MEEQTRSVIRHLDLDFCVAGNCWLKVLDTRTVDYAGRYGKAVDHSRKRPTQVV